MSLFCLKSCKILPTFAKNTFDSAMTYDF